MIRNSDDETNVPHQLLLTMTLGSGMTSLINLNEEMNDIMKIAKLLVKSGLLVKTDKKQ